MSLKERLNQDKIKELKAEIKSIKRDEPQDGNSLGVIDVILNDIELNSVYVSGANNVYLERNGKFYKSTATYRDDVQLENIIKKTASRLGVELDKKNPIVKFNRKTGINVTMTLPPLTSRGTIFVKCYNDSFASFDNLLEYHSISKEMALLLEALSYLGGNIIIAGKKNTMKTTLLSAMSKKLPSKEKGVIIDYAQELNPEAHNITSYNFSFLEDGIEKRELLKSIFSIEPKKIFINSCEDDISYFLDKAMNGFNGFVITLDVHDEQEAVELLARRVLKLMPYLTIENARAIIYDIFEIIIFTERNEDGKCKITSISEMKSNGEIQDIFYLNSNDEHSSNGIVPDFFEKIKENSYLIGTNIFELSYKHTYQKNLEDDLSLSINKNIDILKKFKKRPKEESGSIEEKIEEITDTHTESLDDILLSENIDETLDL